MYWLRLNHSSGLNEKDTGSQAKRNPRLIRHSQHNTHQSITPASETQDMAQPFSPPPGGVEVTGRDGLLCLDLAENVTLV